MLSPMPATLSLELKFRFMSWHESRGVCELCPETLMFTTSELSEETKFYCDCLQSIKQGNGETNNMM